MSDHTDHLLDLIDQRGLIRAREVAEAGIPTVYLTCLVRSGALERVARGVYAKASASVSEHVTLAEVAKVAPRGVICLLSASTFHGFGTQNPQRVWLALPNGSKPPTTVNVRLEVVSMHARALTTGIDTPTIDGVHVPIFGPTKTIADLFKYRSRVGLDIVLEVLREYWNSPHRDIEALSRYAQINGVENVMRPYIEAMAS